MSEFPCGALYVGKWEFEPKRCVMPFQHEGAHTNGQGNYWGAKQSE